MHRHLTAQTQWLPGWFLHMDRVVGDLPRSARQAGTLIDQTLDPARERKCLHGREPVALLQLNLQPLQRSLLDKPMATSTKFHA